MPLSSVFGQARAVETLRSALSHSTVHHAYLFMGPEGVGKELAALGLAQALNCTSKPEGSVDACGACSSCQRLANRSHPDLHWLLPEAERVSRGWAGKSDITHVPSREIKVEQIRALQERLVLRSLEAETKVVLVASAHLMNTQAQNAFLKTLEEPPSRTVMILLASAPERLLPTIKSRCSRVSFGPLPLSFVVEQVKKKRSVDDATAHLMAEMASGSLSLALEWDVGKLDRRKRTIEAFESLSKSDARGWLHFAEEFGESRETAEQALRTLRLWFRDLAVAPVGVHGLLNRDLSELARKVASKHSEVLLHRKVALLDEAMKAISVRNGSARLQLERMLVEMMAQAT